MKQASFPKDFLWGASTAAHQVEGDHHNQWSEWEQANADRLAQTATQRLGWLPDWRAVKDQAETPRNYLSGNGVEHYTRYKEDFALLKQLNLNAFRFGVEWSRIEPKEGEWDEAAIQHYRDYIAELRRQGIEPVLTLWHWTLPVWFADKGGFEKPANLRFFERFVDKVAAEYGDMIDRVIILNEPNVYVAFGYMLGEWPPMIRKPLLGLRVYWNLTRAHRRACAAWKRHNPQAQIGIALHLGDSRPTDPANPLNQAIIRLRDYIWNWWFLDRICRQLDFVGVNFYHTDYANWRGKVSNPAQPVNDLGWYMEPSGLERVLVKTWKRYHKPLIVTENGVADSKDQYRQWWLQETIAAMRRALAQGVAMHGYLHWSLLDNFEWAYGWWPKFGLIAVDRTTMKRAIRPSARWFAKQISQL